MRCDLFKKYHQDKSKELMKLVRIDKELRDMTFKERKRFLRYNPSVHGIDYNPNPRKENKLYMALTYGT